MIDCDNLTVVYGSTTAADSVSFSVDEGEILGLLGPNGAGKTSVIRALTTIIEPDSGGATIDGAPLTESATVRARIGVLPESTGYPGARSAAEYLTFYGRLFGLSRHDAQARSAGLLERVGLAECQLNRISTFSRGMRQRLGIARALVNQPRALFLDEPTLGLDPAGKEDILNFLRANAIETGASVVLCSHLLDEVERVCDRVAIMHQARIAAQGRVADVVASASVLTGARVELHPSDVGRAISTVNERSDMRARPSELAPGQMLVDFKPDGPELLDLARLLADHDLQFAVLETRGARLSDAFLQLTSASPAESSS